MFLATVVNFQMPTRVDTDGGDHGGGVLLVHSDQLQVSLANTVSGHDYLVSKLPTRLGLIDSKH